MCLRGLSTIDVDHGGCRVDAPDVWSTSLGMLVSKSTSDPVAMLFLGLVMELRSEMVMVDWYLVCAPIFSSIENS
eukprot:5376288-Pyramimonas_sp.AAC.1